MSANPKRQKRLQRRLRLERLDDRILMSVSPPQAVTVMSENLYLGADLIQGILPGLIGSPAASIPATTQMWKDVQATKFNERADAIVKQILADKPDLIGLQEVTTFRTGIPDSLWGNPTQATKVELDFLKVLQDKLAAKRLPYQTLILTTENDTELPCYTSPGVLQDLRMTDQVAILARKDLVTSGVKFSNAKGKTFVANVTVPTLVGKPIVVQRGWNSVDVNWGGGKFRFVNMCLETHPFPGVQALQAAEIAAGPAATTLPVILVGDSNVESDKSSSYQTLVGAGFKDAWVQTHPGDPGYTYGNQPDLRNSVAMSYHPFSSTGWRFDLVLERGPFKATSMKKLGVLPSERTVSGMWPSDHAGIVATLAVTSPLPKGVTLGQSTALVAMDSAALATATSTGGRDVPGSSRNLSGTTGTRLDRLPDPAGGDIGSTSSQSRAPNSKDAAVGSYVAAPSLGRLGLFNYSDVAEPARPKLPALVDRLMADDASDDLLPTWNGPWCSLALN